MSEYKTIPTTYEVWKTIKEHHPDLVVFGSFSAPDGDYFGDPNRGKMFTSYGFKNTDYPIVQAETQWNIGFPDRSVRHDEEHEYWLCVAIEEND
jgi:hypothetical protein